MREGHRHGFREGIAHCTRSKRQREWLDTGYKPGCCPGEGVRWDVNEIWNGYSRHNTTADHQPCPPSQSGHYPLPIGQHYEGSCLWDLTTHSSDEVHQSKGGHGGTSLMRSEQIGYCATNHRVADGRKGALLRCQSSNRYNSQRDPPRIGKLGDLDSYGL